MKPAHKREEVLLREALARAIGPDRQVFLDQACAGNQALRARLEGLLQGHQGLDPFLEAQTAPSGITTVLVPLEEGPGTLIGRYKLLDQIGEGGFGVVYVAEQQEPVRRKVALKIIKLGLDLDAVTGATAAATSALVNATR